MKPKGFILTTNKDLFCVMDIAVDKSSYLVLNEEKCELQDIQKKNVLLFLPFIKKQGYLIPVDKTELEQSLILTAMSFEIPDKNPRKQLRFLMKNYPEYWKREKQGEFYISL